MAKKNKQERKVIEYGNEKQTIPVYIPARRYRALKSLALELNKPLNQLIRDIIEEAYGNDLDRIEDSLILHSGEQDSSTLSSKAYERLAS